MNPTRRSVLKAGVGATTFGALAGCLASPDEDDEGENAGYANFFALWDWASEVGGEAFAFENPVEAGSMGHGWSPDGDLAREIAATDLFLYLDTPEFGWAQDVATELERDYEDVAVIDVMQRIEPYLIPFESEPLPEPDYDHEFSPDALVLEDFDIYDLRSNEQLGYWHVEHWHGGVPDVVLGDTVPFGVVIEDEEGHVLPLGEDQEYQLDARIADGEDESVARVESHGDHVEFHGEELGSTAAVIELRRGEELIYDTGDEPSSFDVVEAYDGEGADEFHDPHVWADPGLVERMVETIADELVAIDPDNEPTYRENAAAYTGRLQDVHQQFETLFEEAEHDVAVFAGHDSFGYLERRYDFELRTPTGVSPNAAASFEDVADLIEVIKEHDLDTVLYDPFEAPTPGEDVPQIVETIFENSDVENAEPLTPGEGTTAEWVDNGYGWVEQMTEINIPSLEAALNPR